MVKSMGIPGIDIPVIRSIPVLVDIVSGHNVFTYVAFILVIVVWFLMYRMPLGLRIRAVGENSSAARSVGENPTTVSYTHLDVYTRQVNRRDGSHGGRITGSVYAYY